MFGIFRLGLALLVVVYHASERHLAGWYSVYAFYALSGFLMTLVIAKKYGMTPQGIGSFVRNRALRIYPPYLAVAASSLLLLHLPYFSQVAKEFGGLGLPEGPLGWFENLFIWGWHMRDPKLVPQVWTVFRELFFCVLIFYPFARFRWLSLAWFAGSLVYAASTLLQGKVLLDVYTSFSAASIAYSAGCCIYHFRSSLRFLTRPLGPLIGVAVVAPFAFEAVRPGLFSHGALLPLYVNAALSAWLVLLLSCLKGSPRWQSLDRRLGNLSYPVYLCHGNVTVVLVALLPLPALPSDQLLLVSFLPTLACAWLLNRYVEQTVGYGYDQRRQLRRLGITAGGSPESGSSDRRPALAATAPASGLTG